MTARDYALIQLDATPLPGWPTGLVKHRGKINPPDDARDLGLAEQIFVGVLKNLFLLRHRMSFWSGRPLEKIDPLVQKILALGLYQLGFLDRIPQSAAVNEAAEQARRFGRRSAVGFVNAVLRNATRTAPPPVPDPAIDPRGYGHIELSHPLELIDRLLTNFDPEQMLELCRHNNQEPPTLVRLFSGTDPKTLEIPGIEITPHQQAGIYIVRAARQPVFADWANSGIAQVQDATAAGVVDHLDLQPGQTVLDRCAGLGTKTLQIQERIANGRVFAIDPSAARCQSLRHLLALRGIDNVAVIQTPLLAPSATLLTKSFDRILVDAPCSNSGVLSRRPEARYAQDDPSIQSLAQLQMKILHDTAPWLAPDGLLLYSTCSIWKDENQLQIHQFLQQHPDYELVKETTILPSMDPDPRRYHDGGYIAVLRKRSPA